MVTLSHQGLFNKLVFRGKYERIVPGRWILGPYFLFLLTPIKDPKTEIVDRIKVIDSTLFELLFVQASLASKIKLEPMIKSTKNLKGHPYSSSISLLQTISTHSSPKLNIYNVGNDIPIILNPSPGSLSFHISFLNIEKNVYKLCLIINLHNFYVDLTQIRFLIVLKRLMIS